MCVSHALALSALSIADGENKVRVPGGCLGRLVRGSLRGRARLHSYTNDSLRGYF